MNKADISENAVTEEEYSLSELQHWLQYGKHGWSILAGIFFIPYNLILTGLKIAVVVFLPYMLWHLYKAKWYKSVIVFLFVVVLPYIITLFINVENIIFDYLLLSLPLLTFFIYTYIISYMIGEELNRIKTMKKWDRERRKVNIV